MSLETLQNNLLYMRSQEDLIDAAGARRDAVRRQKTPSEHMGKKADELYAYCLEQFPAALSESHGLTLNISIDEGSPYETDVVEMVEKRFTNMGFAVQHNFNDGYNRYDFLELSLPEDWVQRLLTKPQA